MYDMEDETTRRSDHYGDTPPAVPQPASPALTQHNPEPTNQSQGPAFSGTQYQSPYYNPGSVPYEESTVPYPRASWQQPPQQPQQSPVQPATQIHQPSRGLRTGAILLLTLLLAVVFGTGLFAGWEFGRGGGTATAPGNSSLQTGSAPQATVPVLTGNNLETVQEAVIAKVRPAVVQINVTTSQGNAIGSGVIIDQRGYIVTNNHVINGARTIQVVLNDGTRLTGQLAGADPTDDLAIVKINTSSKNLAVATLGDSSQLKVGQDVLAIGNPLGITQTVTKGIVSALNRNVSEGQGGATLPGTIQTDAPINPGNSGGALVDLQGNLIGIPTLTAIDPEFNTPASGVGFAIPSNRVKLIAEQIINTGSVTHTGRAAMNIRVVDVTSDIAARNSLSVDHGVLITDVISGGAASRAGLQPGDVIVQIDNSIVNDVSGLGDALSSKNPGDTVAVKIYRGNQQRTMNVTLGELQAQ